MAEIAHSPHPLWCLGGPECAGASGLHLSEVQSAAQRGNEVIQVGAGLWQMDVGPTSPCGVLLELSGGEEVQRWPVDLAQARALAGVLQRLLATGGPALPRAA